MARMRGTTMAALFPPSREQKEEIDLAFCLIQEGESDYVDFHRVKVVLKAMGMQPRKGELLQTLHVSCPLSDGSRISKEEFTAIMMRFLARRDARTRLKQDFDIIDHGGKGFIDIRDLQKLSKCVEEKTRSDSILREMIRNFDKDGDGKWNLDEFIAAVGHDLERREGEGNEK